MYIYIQIYMYRLQDLCVYIYVCVYRNFKVCDTVRRSSTEQEVSYRLTVGATVTTLMTRQGERMDPGEAFEM